jgi:hypothetical protein
LLITAPPSQELGPPAIPERFSYNCTPGGPIIK